MLYEKIDENTLRITSDPKIEIISKERLLAQKAFSEAVIVNENEKTAVIDEQLDILKG